MAALTFAIHELKEWFNVKNNLNPDQEALTAELVLDSDNFYDLTLGNIKACFREKMMSAKLYDRLDGNIIIGWLREFKARMVESVYNRHLEQDKIHQVRHVDGMSLDDYQSMLEQRAAEGDPSAQEALARHLEWVKTFNTYADRKQSVREKELAFFKYKQEYLKAKKEKTTTP